MPLAAAAAAPGAAGSGVAAAAGAEAGAAPGEPRGSAGLGGGCGVAAGNECRCGGRRGGGWGEAGTVAGDAGLPSGGEVWRPADMGQGGGEAPRGVWGTRGARDSGAGKTRRPDGGQAQLVER